MRFFVPSLLVSQLLCWSLPSAALNKHTIDVDLQVHRAQTVGGVTSEVLTLCSGPFLNREYNRFMGM